MTTVISFAIGEIIQLFIIGVFEISPCQPTERKYQDFIKYVNLDNSFLRLCHYLP